MSVFVLSCVLLGASGETVETHIHVIERDTGLPVSGIRVHVGDFTKNFYGTTDSRGHVQRPVPSSGVSDGAGGRYKSPPLYIVSPNYRLANPRASIHWELADDLRKGFVILVVRKDPGAGLADRTTTGFRTTCKPCSTVCEPCSAPVSYPPSRSIQTSCVAMPQSGVTVPFVCSPRQRPQGSGWGTYSVTPLSDPFPYSGYACPTVPTYGF